MPKREPTPPLDDDLKYFVVNYPLPSTRRHEDPGGARDGSRGGSRAALERTTLFAIYHKPSVSTLPLRSFACGARVSAQLFIRNTRLPNMVIIEVAKNCPEREYEPPWLAHSGASS